ncbi:hypothetical protein NP234_25000, partial [Salmonella enterica]|nr:hypothetical protein [Salmonella enterica]
MSIRHILFTIASLCLCGCAAGGHEGHDHEHEEADGHEHLGPDDVHFSDAQALAVGLTIDTAHADAGFAPTLPCGGAIEAQAAGSVTIVAPVAGIVSITDTGLAPGAFLTKGQTVATISGKSMQDGDAAAKAQYEYEAAKKEYNRRAALAADKIVSQSELEEARLRLATAQSSSEA